MVLTQVTAAPFLKLWDNIKILRQRKGVRYLTNNAVASVQHSHCIALIFAKCFPNLWKWSKI